MPDLHATHSAALGRIRVLGYAGLIPFAYALLAQLGVLPKLLWTPPDLFVAYGAVILSFMAGVLWGRTLHDPASAPDRWLLLGSNAFALLGWLALGWATESTGVALGLLGLGFLGVWLLEIWRAPAAPNANLSTGYRSLRLQLTVLVLVLHVAMAAAVLGLGA